MSLFDGAAVQLDIFTSGGNCHLLVPHRLCRWKWNFGDSYFFLDGVFLSFLFFLCSDRKVQARQEQGERFLPVILPSVQPTVCRMTGWRRPPPWRLHRPPPPLLKRPPENNEIWCCNKVVEKAVFQWCYLSCSVPTPCNDDLSLFSVMCSIFIYDQASFSLYFFGFITHFFCAIPATNEKIKKRNILWAVSNTFSVA